MPPIVLRIRTQLGTWRINDVMSGDSLAVLRRRYPLYKFGHYTEFFFMIWD